MDPLSAVQDEVALEGLDGITAPSLWIRLESRKPSFALKLDTCTKEYIWRSLVANAGFEFYELPQEREDVVLFDRFADIDPETGIQGAEKFTDSKNDVYPVQVIVEDKNGIQGSCVFYKERRNVTKNVRTEALKALITLEEAFKRYGKKLVIVASQMQRFRALIGPENDPDLKLNDHSYCILERLGRARWQGELQRDLHACSFKTDAGKLHYMRRFLDRHGLITMQSHVIRLSNGHQQHSILLLLKRFHINRRSKYDILMESLSNALMEAPGQLASLITLKEQVNVNETTFKRVYQYMQAAKLVQLMSRPLEEIDPSAGPCTTKKGGKVTIRCLKLLKPYVKKELIVDDDDDEDGEEDATGGGRKALPPEGRLMERDLVLQAYHIVVSAGTRGISQSALQLRMNIGKLEARMICRKLQREGMIKGFMEDVGRQRTTKFIGHMCVGVSNHLQQFAKEQERNKLLCSFAAPKTPQNSKVSPGTPRSRATPRSKGKGTETPVGKQIQGGGEDDRDGDETVQSLGEGDQDSCKEGEGKSKGKSGGSKKKAGVKGRKALHSKQDKAELSAACSTPKRSNSRSRTTPSASESSTTAVQSQDDDGTILSPCNLLDQSEALNSNSHEVENNVTVVEDSPTQKVPCVKSKKGWTHLVERPHETYRLLRRKNLIVETVHNLKIVEGLYMLQKMINDDEKQDGVSTKCCKKSIIRLIRSLSKEGMLKLYTTTVVQDGVSKKIEMVVHPSVQPNDEIVKRAIDQVRFRISSSYSVAHLQHEKDKEQSDELKETNALASKAQKGKANKKKTCPEEYDFKPKTVKGLSRDLGFQPKMHRLRVMHTFLWCVLYGHPLQQDSPQVDSSNQPEADPSAPGQGAAQPDSDANLVGSTLSNSEVTSLGVEISTNASEPHRFDAEMKVYVNEESWKRFLPPIRVHKEYGRGWAQVSDVLLCLPLSIFIQITQINYQIDGLEDYLNDPVKQHFLIRALPSKMKWQLLYKRRYIFSFHENMQKLAYMGLMQFGPVEKFQDKDQIFLYVRRHASIVDTTSAEPHYWQVTELPDKPFERRQYTLATAQDVENYWFDLLCVCLNTPLGVIRSKRGEKEEMEQAPPALQERSGFLKFADLLKGCREITDDGSIPGDGKGAGGLDSEFFSHLKRNWLWTNRLLSCKKSNVEEMTWKEITYKQANHSACIAASPYQWLDFFGEVHVSSCGGLYVLRKDRKQLLRCIDNTTDEEMSDTKTRLKSLLSRNTLRIALKAGVTTCPRRLSTKRPLIMEEDVEMAVEPASRNQQVVGGKRQKRKRTKKEVVKVPRKKRKEPKKRTPAHDEADHRALKRMTRQRVYWSVQEDSMMMLCSVALKLLNSELTRPFVPHCVVRDLLQAELEKSMDKTSLAVARRTRYILKNPQTLLNYRICLAEVYQDKTLMGQLAQNKPTDPNEPEDCAEAFCAYVKLLRQKFSSSMASCDVTIPNTKHQLFAQYKVYTIDDENKMSFKDTITCLEDIHALVLHNLIQSTLVMSNSQMKTSRSFQTFHMYSMYSQEVLCQVFIECRKRGLVNRRRVSKVFGPKKNRALPILPMSYQLSQTYYRCFAWRFPFTLFTDVFRFIRTLTDNGTGEDEPPTSFYHETESMTDAKEGPKGRGAEPEEACVPGKDNKGLGPGKEILREEEGDRDDTLTSEGDQGKETEKRTEMEPRDAKAEEMKSSETNAQNNLHLQAKDSFSLNVSLEPPGPELPSNQEPRDLSHMLRFPLDSPGGSCVACLSLMSLGLLSVHVSIPKQMVVVDSTLVDNEVVKGIAALEEEEDEEDEGEECEGKKRLEVKAHQASHTNYLMMRGYCFPGIVKLRNLNTNDNIVVESCILRFQLRNTPTHQIFDIEDSPPLDFYKCGPSLLPANLSHTIRLASHPPGPSSPEQWAVPLRTHRGFSPQDVEACAELRTSLDEAGGRGMSTQDLYRVHVHLAEPACAGARGLQQYLQELQEEGQVMKVGAMGERWVLSQHAAPWLLPLNSKSRFQRRPAQEGMPPIWETQHNIPFMHTSSQNDLREVEEPPAKKVAEDTDGERPGERGGPMDQTTGEERNSGRDFDVQQDAETTTSGDVVLNPEVEARKPTLGKRWRGTREVVENGVCGKNKETEQKDKEEWMEVDGDEDSCSPSPSAATSDAGDKDMSFISRPWRMVDGSLNRPACKGMLEGVLCHIMSRPGLTQQTLVEHYKDVLQPMAVLDLIEALVEMGCVRKKSVVRVKTSLFSRCVGQKAGGTAEGGTDTVFYEPTIGCCLRLAQVLPNEPHWNQFIQ